jgi:hypothetical protein
LANEWDVHPLVDWGLDVWQPDIDVDLDSFFEELPTDTKETTTINLTYSEDEYHQVISALNKMDGSKEDIIFKLITK